MKQKLKNVVVGELEQIRFLNDGDLSDFLLKMDYKDASE